MNIETRHITAIKGARLDFSKHSLDMDWVTNFLKHLGISRSVIGAAFITSAVLYAGPRVAPAYIEPIPKEWAPAVLAVVKGVSFGLFFECS